MSAEGITARAIAIGHRISAPPGDITPRRPLGFPARAGRRDQGGQRWPKGPVSFGDGGAGGEAFRRVRGDVVAGGNGREV